MTVDDIIQKLENMKYRGEIEGDELLYFGDKQQSVDYFVKNDDGKLTLKEEWY